MSLGLLIRERCASFGAEGSAPCASLPSSTAAARLVGGDVRALPMVGVTFLGRAALLAAGMALFGERTHLARNSLAGAAAIEAFVLGYTAAKQKGLI